jgi:hypothetical protein
MEINWRVLTCLILWLKGEGASPQVGFRSCKLQTRYFLLRPTWRCSALGPWVVFGGFIVWICCPCGVAGLILSFVAGFKFLLSGFVQPNSRWKPYWSALKWKQASHHLPASFQSPSLSLPLLSYRSAVRFLFAVAPYQLGRWRHNAPWRPESSPARVWSSACSPCCHRASIMWMPSRCQQVNAPPIFPTHSLAPFSTSRLDLCLRSPIRVSAGSY